MRTRTVAALSAAALAAIVLAGCSSPTSTASPTATPAVDLCSAQAPSGAATDAVTVEGAVGTPSTATFTTPVEVTAAQSRTITEGSGPALSAGDFVRIAYTVYNAQTGAALGSDGYTDGELLPTQVSPDSNLGKIVGCAPVGSRFVAALPGASGSAGEIYVFDVLGTVPTSAWGVPQEPAVGFPTVALADDGAPTITVPGGAAPTTVQITDLKKGDGPVVASGDNVLVQYTGALWSDGTVFDSSWQRGVPASFKTTGVVEGFKQALEGQTVGSQVLVVIPPEFGYGANAQGAIPANSTLVFVVDILGTQHAS